MFRKQWLIVVFLIVGALSGFIIYSGDVISGNETEDASAGYSEPFQFQQVDVGLSATYSNNQSDATTDITPDGMEMVTNAGVYVSDYNRDGWPDILTVGTAATESGNGSDPILFENEEGEFKSADALPSDLGEVKSALFFDYNDDGWDDLLLLRINDPPVLLENVEGGYERHNAGFERSLQVPTGATTADFNEDGCPDLFVIQNGNWDDRRPVGIRNYSSQGIDNGGSNHLYIGECEDGEISFSQKNESGISGERWSLAVSAGDLNNDGHADIHVANDYNHDIYYRNKGNGTFEQVRLPERTNQNGMASELADVNGDERLDIFVTNIYLPDRLADSINDRLIWKNDGNNLLINQGDGNFTDRGREQDVQKGGWGWAAVISDLDNDGDEDLVHTTRKLNFGPLPAGNLKPEVRKKISARPMYSHPIVRERHNGTFHEVEASDVGFNASNGRGLVRLDYDRDGDMELVFATKSQFRVYDNTGQTGNALQVRVEDSTGSIEQGAEVTIDMNDESSNNYSKSQWRTVRPFTDFLSQDERLIHFGVRDAEIASVTIRRPDGTTQTLENIETDQRLIVQPDGIVERRSLDK